MEARDRWTGAVEAGACPAGNEAEGTREAAAAAAPAEAGVVVAVVARAASGRFEGGVAVGIRKAEREARTARLRCQLGKNAHLTAAALASRFGLSTEAVFREARKMGIDLPRSDVPTHKEASAAMARVEKDRKAAKA